MTTVIQGASGAGKSALLVKIAEDWPLGAKDKPVAIRLAASSLKLPMAGLLEVISRKAGANIGIKRTLSRFFHSISVNIAGMVDVTFDVDSLKRDGRSLTPVFPVYGGLANSTDLLRSAGLTRLGHGFGTDLAGV